MNLIHPPGLFFVITAVLPYLSGFYTFVPLKLKAHPDFILYKRLNALSLEQAIIAGVLFISAWPIAFSLVIQLSRRQPISRTALRPILEGQAYCLGSFLLLCVYSTFVAQLITSLAPIRFLPMLYFYWFIYQEVVIIRREVSIKTMKAIGVFFLSLVAAFALIIFMQILLALAIRGIPLKFLTESVPK